MNDQVTHYIQATQPWQIAVCEALRTVIHEAVPNIEEQLEYGKPHFLKQRHYVAVIHVAKAKVSFMLFNASGLPETKGFLRSMGDGERKVVDIIEDQPVDYAAVAQLLIQTSSSL
jgi:hypothetical protein